MLNYCNMPMRSGKLVEHLKVDKQPVNDNLRVISATGSNLYLLVNLQMLSYMDTPLGDPLRNAQSPPILDRGKIRYSLPL